jgi:hypothetical protein
MYDSPWYDASLHFRKDLGIMISRSMKPSYLTGGKLYIVSLETYRAVMSHSVIFITYQIRTMKSNFPKRELVPRVDNALFQHTCLVMATLV